MAGKNITSGCNRPQKLSLVLPKNRQNNCHFLRRLSQALCVRGNMSNHLEKWQNNESLLQSYRQIFIGSQSFMLAVGAILFNATDPLLLVIIAILSLAIIWYIWFLVVIARHKAVDYHKYLTLRECVPDGVCSEEDYINDPKLRLNTNKLLGISTNWRPTRKKIDLYLPIIYSVAWVGLVCFKYGT
jgi:hypothetical protein